MYKIKKIKNIKDFDYDTYLLRRAEESIGEDECFTEKEAMEYCEKRYSIYENVLAEIFENINANASEYDIDDQNRFLDQIDPDDFDTDDFAVFTFLGNENYIKDVMNKIIAMPLNQSYLDNYKNDEFKDYITYKIVSNADVYDPVNDTTVKGVRVHFKYMFENNFIESEMKKIDICNDYEPDYGDY